MDLNDIRARIDETDRELVRLFCQRTELVEQVAAYKKSHNLQVFQKEREDAVLEKVSALAPAEMKNAVSSLFTFLMDVSKSRQLDAIRNVTEPVVNVSQPELPSPLRVGLQGVSGCYAHIAAETAFSTPQITFLDTYDAVFSAVESDAIDVGVLPIENAIAGSVHAVYNAMLRHDFLIIKAVTLKINHCLCARPGVALTDISEVHSHEQALRQCSCFLSEKGCTSIEESNTAVAAELVARSSTPVGVICSRRCADEYGLVVLADNIADDLNNSTRFICIAKPTYAQTRGDTVSVAVTALNEPGALMRLLTKFSIRGVNLLKIESRPAGSNFNVVFYIDFAGDVGTVAIQNLLEDLCETLPSFRMLGGYPTLES